MTIIFLQQLMSIIIYLVDDSDYVEAKLVLGSNNISSAGYTLDDAVSSSLSTTETVMKEKYTAYLESKFKQDLESMDAIKSARVISHILRQATVFSQRHRMQRLLRFSTLKKNFLMNRQRQ